MLWIYSHSQYCSFFQCGGRLYTSESDVYRRQILTCKPNQTLIETPPHHCSSPPGPRAERVKKAVSAFWIFILQCVTVEYFVIMSQVYCAVRSI